MMKAKIAVGLWPSRRTNRNSMMGQFYTIYTCYGPFKLRKIGLVASNRSICEIPLKVGGFVK
jgi:hypothetical protein